MLTLIVAVPLPFYLQEDDPPAKREILRAALKLFSRGGLDSTSIRDIAAESGYTNPALYKHFASKEELALYLFTTGHERVWTSCSAALAGGKTFEAKLDAYIGRWLQLIDDEPELLAFLSDSGRVLWPKAAKALKRRSMISLAQRLTAEAPRRSKNERDIAAAAIQGTLAELARLIQVGVVKGPATRWKAELVSLSERICR